jgi:hypothetical protein
METKRRQKKKVFDELDGDIRSQTDGQIRSTHNAFLSFTV